MWPTCLEGFGAACHPTIEMGEIVESGDSEDATGARQGRRRQRISVSHGTGRWHKRHCAIEAGRGSSLDLMKMTPKDRRRINAAEGGGSISVGDTRARRVGN